MRLILAFFIILTLSLSCKKLQKEEYNCDTINDTPLTILKGVMYITAKNTIVFHKLDFIQNNRYGRKMHLIPYNDKLENIIFEEYDTFIYLKNHSDFFWVSIEGLYLTSDTLKQPQKFLLKSFSIELPEEQAQLYKKVFTECCDVAQSGGCGCNEKEK